MGLVKLEKYALEAMNRKDYRHAIALYKEIISQNPGWEHGQAFYDLAGCYEDIGNLEKAKENYLRALEIQPNYHIFVGGYAGFLDQYGDPREAFELYLKLLRLETEFKPLEWGPENQQQIDRIKSNLYVLGARLGWNQDDVEKVIA